MINSIERLLLKSTKIHRTNSFLMHTDRKTVDHQVQVTNSIVNVQYINSLYNYYK